MTKVPLYQVDAFTSERFRGNPAGVCVLESEISEELMQAIAAEMNLSETAFVLPQGPVFSLRWFTPASEVPLCGHATLATAHVLFNHLKIAGDAVRFQTLSGELVAEQEGDRIKLDFPIGNPQPVTPPREITEALGLTEAYDDAQYCNERNKFLIRLKDEEILKAVTPDFQKMASYKPGEMIGVIITSRSGRYDFVSRFFAPSVGVNEDPVTGSAHTVLGPYWSRILDKKEMRAYQASRRGGELTVRLKGDRVDLIGEAVIVANGTFRVD